MAELLDLEVATPTGLALRVECESVSAPSVEGEFGVLPGHLPLLAALQCGLLRYVVEGKGHVAAVGPGYVSANAASVELLTDLYAAPDIIDVPAVQEELAEAHGRLKAYAGAHEGAEYRELRRDVDWAQARLHAAAESDR